MTAELRFRCFRKMASLLKDVSRSDVDWASGCWHALSTGFIKPGELPCRFDSSLLDGEAEATTSDCADSSLRPAAVARCKVCCLFGFLDMET